MPRAGTLGWMCLLVILWTSASSSQKTECIKMNPCKCIMKDGSGVINLAAMGDSDGFLERNKPLSSSDGESDADILYSFSPCRPFSEPIEFAPECLDVAVCLTIRYQSPTGEIVDFLNFGRHEGNEFNYDNNSKALTVTYPASHSSPLRTVARYNCSSRRSVALSRDPENPNLLQISVDSPCACPNGCKPQDVGPGTIILIVFSITVTVYFMFGLCALNPVQNAQTALKSFPRKISGAVCAPPVQRGKEESGGNIDSTDEARSQIIGYPDLQSGLETYSKYLL